MTDTRQILNDLSAPAAADPAWTSPGAAGMSRRGFLEGALALAGAGIALPSWLADEVGAAPLGPDDGILVVILLGGGNDGLNTVIPIDDGRYRDLRRGLAVADTAALRIGSGMALHPSLKHLHSEFRAGRLAIVQGAGTVEPDLSHFTSMATWMAGGPVKGVPTGWLGRWLDGRPADHLDGVVVDDQVPMHFVGSRNRGSAVPANLDGIFGTKPSSPGWHVLHEASRRFASTPTGLGALADLTASTQRTAIDFGRQVAPLYANGLPSGGLARRLGVAARIINAGFGTRVIGVSLGSFDHHANQGWQHEAKLRELDEGIQTFFATLDSRWAARTTVATFSEFGRRPEANGSSGTDHGTASVMFLAGAAVNGGLHGQQPSLSDLDRHGNLKVNVDFRSVYATVLDRWLGADSGQILGGRFETLPLFRATPSGAPGSGLPATAVLPRLAGADRVGTAVAVSAAGWDAAPAVVLASGLHFEEALPAGVLAAARSGPLLLCMNDALPESVARELGRLGTRQAFVVGSLPATIDARLTALGIHPTRIGAPGQPVSTAAAIAAAIGQATTALIVNRDAFPDAVAAAGLAARRGWPVLLARRDEMPGATIAAARAAGVTTAVLVGGTAVLSDAAARQAAALGTVQRLAGASRYETSAAVTANGAGDGFGDLLVVTGTNYPDALAAAPLAARTGAQVVLVDGSGGGADRAVLELLRARRSEVGDVRVLGGELAVDRRAEAGVASALGR